MSALEKGSGHSGHARWPLRPLHRDVTEEQERKLRYEAPCNPNTPNRAAGRYVTLAIIRRRLNVDD